MDTHVGPTSRRAALRGIGGVGLAAALALTSYDRAAANTGGRFAHSPSGTPPSEPGTAAIEPGAGAWKTWLLTSGNALRPEAPPDALATEAELALVQAMTADRGAAGLDRISYWDAGSPGYRWNELAMQQTEATRSGPGDAYRTMALLNAAIYDATIAAWDAKYAYNRPRPAGADASRIRAAFGSSGLAYGRPRPAIADTPLTTVIATPASPSYPSVHAATAGAASTVLAYLFPDRAETFARLATEAVQTRLLAGVAYPSDVQAGLALGKQVGERFIARAASDGSDAAFDPASLPAGPGLWFGDPAAPTLGSWQTWVLKSADQFRPGPPPAPDSPERAAELAEVKTYPRDAHPYSELWFWPQDPAGRPEPDAVPVSSNQVVFYYAPVLHLLWGPELAQKLFEYRLDANPPRAARAYALVSIASFDATVASWEAKFHYLTARPTQFDSTITTILPTYPIPDYPSGHATTLGGTAEVLAYLFPREAYFFQSRAEECAASRLWAGIHFRSACAAGLQLGRDVGQAVIAWAEADGAD